MTIGQTEMPRASALAPQAVSGVRSLYSLRISLIYCQFSGQAGLSLFTVPAPSIESAQVLLTAAARRSQDDLILKTFTLRFVSK